MTNVVEIQSVEDPRDVIHEAVQHLSEGRLVCLPSETMYVVACEALHEQGLELLGKVQKNVPAAVCSLALQDPVAAWDYVPQMSDLGKRLCRRCWPGPVSFSFEMSEETGLIESLPESSRRLVIEDNYLRLSIPAEETIQAISSLMPRPLVLLSTLNSEKIPRTADDAIRLYGNEPAMLIDAGPSRYGATATEVRVGLHDWDVVTESIVPGRTIQRLASFVYLFVCTGNTCRSPMAEGMFRKMLAQRLKCTEEELSDRGHIVASAGIAAGMGGRASPESVELMQARGIDLNQHASQPLTGQLLQTADHVYTMTSGHRDSILLEDPTAESRVSVLSDDGRDISDPYGYGIEKYHECVNEIERSLQAILADLSED